MIVQPVVEPMDRFTALPQGALHLPADAALRPRLDLLDLLLPPPAAAVHQGSFR